MVLSLLCNHWQFLLGFSAMAKQNQNKKKTQNQKNMTRPNSLPLLPPLGCAIIFFVFFFVSFFLVFWFLGLLFSGSLLAFVQWLNKTKIQKHTKKTKTKKPKKQNKKNKMTRPNSLPLLTPLGCAILFFFVSWFLVFWFVVGFCAMVKQNLNPKNKKKTKTK